jgi:NADH-quinone oxidoreductase subunit J
VEGVGKLLFTDYLLPFEIVSLLLLAAIMGAVILTRREKGDGP